MTFVQRYYALLPGNTPAAFALLGPRARSQAGGAAGFTTFYARMQTVTVQNPGLVGNNVVNATRAVATEIEGAEQAPEPVTDLDLDGCAARAAGVDPVR